MSGGRVDTERISARSSQRISTALNSSLAACRGSRIGGASARGAMRADATSSSSGMSSQGCGPQGSSSSAVLLPRAAPRGWHSPSTVFWQPHSMRLPPCTSEQSTRPVRSTEAPSPMTSRQIQNRDWEEVRRTGNVPIVALRARIKPERTLFIAPRRSARILGPAVTSVESRSPGLHTIPIAE